MPSNWELSLKLSKKYCVRPTNRELFLIASLYNWIFNDLKYSLKVVGNKFKFKFKKKANANIVIIIRGYKEYKTLNNKKERGKSKTKSKVRLIKCLLKV